MRLYVGTSGYSYKAWKGAFYPQKLPAGEMLRYYGQRFRTVEINNTFYRMPTAAVLEGWARQVPASFRFVLKASRRITHDQRLSAADDSVSHLLKVAAVLERRLGPVLFQLPPGFKKDAARLREFLAHLPAGRRAAFEFRHPSWFDQETLDILRGSKAALCIADAEGGPEVPLAATTDWGYLRLRRSDYARADLKAWLQRLRDQSWRDAFVFFKHEEAAKGPQLARQFLELAA